MEYRKPSGAEWKRTAVYLVLYIIAIGVGAFLLMHRGAAGATAWAVIVLGGAFLLIRWHAKNTAYRCAGCRHEFEISIPTDAVSPHGAGGGGWKYLRCPRCGKKTKAEILWKE